jgi:hypothetical protein
MVAGEFAALRAMTRVRTGQIASDLEADGAAKDMIQCA